MKVTKTLCDNCKKEIPKTNDQRISFEKIEKLHVGGKYIPYVKESDFCSPQCLYKFLSDIDIKTNPFRDRNNG